MATDATFDNQLQALATATANFAADKDATIKNTIITALGGSTQQGGGSGKTEGVITSNWDGGKYTITYNGDGTLYKVQNAAPTTIQSGATVSGGSNMYFFATATDNFTAAAYILYGTGPA